MEEQKFQVFIDSVAKYFSQLGDESMTVDSPYLSEAKRPVVYDYTGVIGITGSKKGLVYFSAGRGVLKQILSAMDEVDDGENNLVDLVGEVANTISGNARSEFGPDFNISIPFVFKGAPDNVMLPRDKHSFVIPVSWKNEKAAIVVCLQS